MNANGAAERFLGRSISSMADVVRQEFGVEIDHDFLNRMREALYARFRRELQPIAGIERAVAGLKELGLSWCVASSSHRERIELSLARPACSTFSSRRSSAPPWSKTASRRPISFFTLPLPWASSHRPAWSLRTALPHCRGSRGRMRVCAFTGGSHTVHTSYQEALTALHPDARFDAMEELLHFVDGARRPKDHSDA